MPKRDRKILLITVCFLLIVVSCTSESPSGPGDDGGSSQDQFELNPDLEEQISSAEQSWFSHGINEYVIEVTLVYSWHFQTHRVQVHNGEVLTTSASCMPSPKEGDSCEVQAYVAENFTVQGLFRYARTEARRDGGAHTVIDFDTTYGIPVQIRYNNPSMVDEEFTLIVLVFEPFE